MDQTSTSDFDQKFELINPFDLISALVIETFRIEALQDGLLRQTEPKGSKPEKTRSIWMRNRQHRTSA